MLSHLSGRVIIIVEDEALTAEALVGRLEGENKVRAFGAAEDALAAIPELGAIDLFIIDYKLPGIDGIEFFKRVKVQQPQAKYLLISGEIDLELASRVNEIGFDGLILKPFDFEILEQNVKTLLG